MAGLEDHVGAILSHWKNNVPNVILAGDVGAGKTWLAGKVCESAFRKGLSYWSLWVSPAENARKKDLGKKDLLRIIASQLSLSSVDEAWDGDEDNEELVNNDGMEQEDLRTRILEKLEKMKNGKTKSHAMKTARGTHGGTEEMRYLIVVLDGVTKKVEKKIVSKLESLLASNPLRILITRKEPGDITAGDVQEGDAVERSTEIIKLEPVKTNLLDLLRGDVRAKIKGNSKLENAAEKALASLPAINLVAGAINQIIPKDEDQALKISMDGEAYLDLDDIGGVQNRDRALGFAVEDAANLNLADIDAVIRFAYDMLPEGVTRKCFWLSHQLFHSRDAVLFNELITYWILEGCFDHHSRIEKAYEEAHDMLMDFMCRKILKGHMDYVYMENAMLKLPDERKNGLSGSMMLGLASVRNDSLGRITLADGMIRSVCRLKEKKEGDKETAEITTLVIEGSRLCEGLSEKLLKSMKGLNVLAVLNPMFESLPDWLTEKKDLEVLVLRGCQHLNNVDGISELTKLIAFEVSDAPLLKDIDTDAFKDMKNLKSVNLSGLHISCVPQSLFDRVEVRFLILRECPEFKELPSLRNMKNLEMVDLCGSASFGKLSDGNISTLTELKTLNVSGTEIKTLPILGNLEGLTRILLRNCTALTMVRSLDKMTKLEVLDISGSMSIQDLNGAKLHGKPQFRLLDLSGVGISAFPDNISDLCHLRLKGCQKLGILKSISTFRKLESLDLSGASILTEIKDEFLANLSCLRLLDLSETMIGKLPKLSNLVELRKLLLKSCKHLTELQGLAQLEKLEVIDLSGCSSLKISSKESFSHMSRLQLLDLSETKTEALPRDCFPSNLCRLILRDCKMLKTLPSLESLSKLEELDLSITVPAGAESMLKFKADFLSNMEKLNVLKLSNTHPDGLPSLSPLKKLRKLELSGCPVVPLGLQDLEELLVLDLSRTKIQKLPPLENISKLRKLLLHDCSELEPLQDLGCLSQLEVLDLSGTKITRCPIEGNNFRSLTKLCLLNVKQMQVDWSKIKYVPADIELDVYQPPEAGTSEISSTPTTESRSPSILVRGTGFFRLLEKNSVLWDSSFKEFHFSVWLSDSARGDEMVKVPGDMSIFQYLNPRGRFPDSGKCSLLEIHESSEFPSELSKILGRAQYISVINNEEFKSISMLGKVSLMERCWLEGCPNLPSVFGDKDREIGERLKGLYLCRLSSLERLYNGQLQPEIFSKLTKLHIDCCPKLVYIFSSSWLPQNLEILKVKFCNELKSLFEGSGSAKDKMSRMKTLVLIDLPELTRIGVDMPDLETLKVRSCKNLNDSELNQFPNLKLLIVVQSASLALC